MGTERKEGRDEATVGDAQQTLKKALLRRRGRGLFRRGREMSCWRNGHPVLVLFFVALLHLEGALPNQARACSIR